jgi:hypothetical protein
METLNKVLTWFTSSYDLTFYITYFIFVGLGILVSLKIQPQYWDKYLITNYLKIKLKVL